MKSPVKRRRLLINAVLVSLTMMCTAFVVKALYESQPIPIRHPDSYIQRNEIPTLQVIAGDAATDEEVTERVIAYFDENREWLAYQLVETDPERLAALFAMYLVHISKPYNTTDSPASLMDFLEMPNAHCGTYSSAQSIILDAMGIENRTINVDHGNHALVEALIHERWEVFDATTNVWLGGSVDEVMRGQDVERRMYYTPALDPTMPEEYRAQFTAFPNANTSVTLRQQEMYWGDRIVLQWGFF